VVDLDALVAGARSGRPRDIARLISLVENGAEAVPALMRALAVSVGAARVVGITGSPGVGKSTTTSALITALRSRGQRVGVLAVDPSSPFSGGALLGDRIRMQEHATDDGVFIRSMASRGHLGGLSATTPQALRVLEAAGFDVVLIETVGVGQSEVEVAAAADTTLVLLAPGMGDGIQAAKAGILEVGDIFVVNKADRDGADSTVRELRNMTALGDRAAGGWVPPVLKTVASTQVGITELVEAIDRHAAWLTESGELDVRRVKRARDEVDAEATDGDGPPVSAVRAGSR
jgi:LAO/AO transport system kinase